MPARAASSPSTRLARARRTLDRDRLRAPATTANIARNARGGSDRRRRWEPARDALWRLLEPHLAGRPSIAVVGAGNADDLPLARLAGRAREVVLVDLDRPAGRAARRRLRRPLRQRVEVVEHDVTGGACDQIAAAAGCGRLPRAPFVPETPLPGAPYDLVIGDLFYSQLLYPALLDLAVPDARRQAFEARYTAMLVRGAVARLHASAPYGRVVHIHDPLAWLPGRPQPVALSVILDAARYDVAAALRLAARGRGPVESDPRRALQHLGIPVRTTALWHWPFAAGADYLACATVAGAP